MPAPPQVEDLVNSFREQLTTFKDARRYDEYTTRDRFINPLFVALGWDVHNAGKLPEHEREVYFEDRIRREDVRHDAVNIVGKKPDYSFRLNKRRMFYVEAKKPAEDLARNKAHAYQVRAYGWNANLPVSVLTDFEEFFVYDCRIPPTVTDDPRTGLVPGMSFTYEQYLTEWDKIADLLHRDSVLAGSLDRYREAVKPTRGAQTVDAAFLRDISLWREALARDINSRNPNLSQDDLNYAVQMTINRIIFLRICEDRGIEHPETLKGTLTGGRTIQDKQVVSQAGYVYRALMGLFRRADQVYNSGLFHFNKNEVLAEQPDAFTPTLDVGDDVLADIINHLYYPYPYKFDVIPVEILGQVYEQFLGKVIVKQPGGGVDVDYKPEVRKAGGVYYTPTYIVDYIVEHTVGKLLEGKAPEQVAELRVLDPACGSGSFLVGAYQYLLDWHLRYYTRDPNEAERLANKRKDRPIDRLPSNAGQMQAGGPGYRLTIHERKRILLNNIYGVDIDSQAVEVTKLSLLLKVVEGEQERQEQLSLDLDERERILPDLGNNIKWGNSLIGPDFYEGTQLTMFDEAEMRRVNAFDWQREFPDIMQRGGFDAVIGNPPYLAGREWTDDLWQQRPYFIRRYSCMTDQYDLYALFIQKAQDLLKSGGKFGFITPNTWLNNEHYYALRVWLVERAQIEGLADFRDINVFPSATVLPIIIISSRATNPDKSQPVTIDHFTGPSSYFQSWSSVSAWEQFPNLVFNLSLDHRDLPVVKKIEKAGVPLSALADVRFGVKVYQRGKGSPPQTGDEAPVKLFEANTKLDESYYPYLRGKYVQSWFVAEERAWIKYGPHLAEPRYMELFQGPRVLVRRIVGDRLIIAPIEKTMIADQLLHTVLPTTSALNHGYLAALLGSKLIAYYFQKRFNRTEKTFPEIRVAELASLPIRTIDFSNPTDKAHHDRMVQLVTNMLALHKGLAETNNPRTKGLYQSQIEATDRAIDRLVYDLYGLTQDERKIVEGTT